MIMMRVVQHEKMIAHVILGILLFLEGLSKREHCRHEVVYVDEITQHSAVLYWRNSHPSGMKVACAGVRQYITMKGDREVDLDTATQFVPQGVDHAFLRQLQANFNYSCVVETEHGIQKTWPLLFTTLYSAPEEPPTPTIIYDDKQIAIQLFPTSTKYCPIDGYEIQFHILDEHTVHIHGKPDLPDELTHPRGLLASVEDARSSDHPIPFCIAFRNTSLPGHITVSDSFLQGALRSGNTYCVITAAYMDNYEDITIPTLYALSQPSKLFSLTVTTEELPSSELRMVGTVSWLESRLLKLSMALGVISSNLILLYFLVVGCCMLYMSQLPDKQAGNQQPGIEPKGEDTATTHLIMMRELTLESVSELTTQSSSAVLATPEDLAGSVNQAVEQRQFSSHSLPQPLSSSTRSSVPASSSTPVTTDRITLYTSEQVNKSEEMPTEQEDSVCSDVMSAIRQCGPAAGSSITEEESGMVSPSPRTNEIIAEPSVASPSFVHETSHKTEQLRSPYNLIGISGVLKKARYSFESIQSSPASGWSSSSKQPTACITGAQSSDDSSVHIAGNAPSVYSHHPATHSDLPPDTVQTRQMKPCESSLVFVPRGLSHGPQPLHLPPLPSQEHEDLAPDLEMDLYGISYSLDEPLNH